MQQKMMIRQAMRFAVVGVAVTTTASLVGCQSRTDVHSFINNPTPELQTLAERPIDVKTQMAITEDMNWRLFNEDLGRFLLVDRPSRMSPMPVVP